MTSRIFSPWRATGAAVVLGLTTCLQLKAAFSGLEYEWTGAADSNYLNAANWTTYTYGTTTKTAATVAPGATSDIVFTSSASNRVLNLANTATGDATYNIYGLCSAVSLGYTMNLSGTSNGWLVYNIVGRGTHPYAVDPSTTLTGSSANRLSFYLNLGNYSKITFSGGSTLPMEATSGLTYATINMTGNSIIDASGISSAKTSNLLGLGALTMAEGTTVYSGNYGISVNNGLVAGQEVTWGGHIYSASTVTVSSTNYAAANSIVRVTPTGVVDLPGGFLIRYGSQYLVDGVHNGPISTYGGQNGVVGGTGTINGTLAITAGTSLAPAGRSAYGKLTVNGTVNLAGTLSLEMYSGTVYDQLSLNGPLNLLSGSNLAVGVSDTFPLVPARYRLVQLLNGNVISGSLTSYALPGSSWSYVMGADYIDVIYIQLPFVQKYPLLTGNRARLANYVDQVVAAGTPPPSLVDSWNRKDVAFFSSVIDQLSVAQYYSWFPAAIERAESMIQSLDDRMNQRAERQVHSFEAYTFNYRQESSINSDDFLGTAYSNYETQSTILGADYLIRDGLTVGGLFNYGLTHTDLDMSQSVSSTFNYTGALYAQYKPDDWQVQLVGFGGVDDYTARRTVTATTFGENVRGKTNGTHLGGRASAGYTFKTKWFEVTPSISLGVMNFKTSDFQETGTNGSENVALGVRAQNFTSLSGDVGLRVARSFPTKKGGTIRPFVSIDERREVFSGYRTLKAQLWGQQFAVLSPGIQSQGLRYNFGLDYDISHTVSLQVRYSVEHGGVSDESLAIRAGMNAAF